MIKKIKIENFKCFEGTFVCDFNEGLNILVGNNDAGKSTILEAIHLVLSGMFRGRLIQGNLTQYLFNYNVVNEYIKKINNNEFIDAPYILIEVYLDEQFPILEGDKYTDKSVPGKAYGISMKIALDEKYSEEYESVIRTGDIGSLPIEYYSVEWYSFARKALTTRSIPIKSSLIDVGFSKFQNGSDVYISRIVQNILETDEKTKVAQAYRKAKEAFSKDSSINEINLKISDLSKLTDKEISLNVDLSSKSTWDGSLITQLDNVPFDFIGKGEQAIVKTELALSNKKTEESSIILIEEPECHISHARLNQLLKRIKDGYNEKQIIISTHSSFVANKLGLNNLILLNNNETIHMRDIEGMEFFEKVAGYDTLRMILCKKAILVEGDSDELIVQRAYMDNNDGKLPIEDEVEVISVGTSFLRFLEIATKISKEVNVVTDNDGNLEALEKKYGDYIKGNKKDHIDICYDETIYEGELKLGKNQEKAFNYNTLEPLLLKENDLKLFNEIFKTKYKTEDEMHKYMKSHKTECALAIFESTEKIIYPEYIMRAIV